MSLNIRIKISEKSLSEKVDCILAFKKLGKVIGLYVYKKAEIYFLGCFFIICNVIYVNGSLVSNVFINGLDACSNSILANFDITWNNTWRNSSSANN